MSSAPHIVLGGAGVVGRETVRALIARGEHPTSVSRTTSSTAAASSAIADLRDPASVTRILAGAHVAYLTAGLPYTSRAWATQWPVIVRNAIAAAIAHDVHLVYFDNVYAYGRATAAMSENTPVHPSSKKGRVRAIALDLLAEGESRGLRVTIVRAADFFGPGAATSIFNMFALDRIAAGRAATWLYDADVPHSLTYTPDIGYALATVGTTGATPGRIWHVPTAPALTGREYIRLADPTAKVAVMSAAAMRIGAIFASAPRETLEMAYQFTQPYVFSSAAFEKAFSAAPTPTADAIAASLAAARS